MKKTELNWDTSFDTAKNLMIHTFEGGFKMVTDTQTGLSKLFKREVLVAENENYKIGEYERKLIEIAKDARKLKEFNQ